jgi:kynurenine formamidase
MTVNRRHFFQSAAALAALTAAGAHAKDNGQDAADFIRSVLKARVFDLSQTWDENSPIASVNPPYSMVLEKTHASTQGTFGDGGKLSFTAEGQHFSGQHGAPSIDAIGHIGRNGKLFGGVDAITSTSDPRGIGRDPAATGAHLDINHYPVERLVNRGVLLDVARNVQGDATPLPADFKINGEHLKQTAKDQGVHIRKGDTVLIRTGWGQFFASNPAYYNGASSAGVDVDGAQFLVKSGAPVVGNDTLTFEARPPVVNPGTPQFEVFPVHMLLIPDNGINIIENFYLEDIAAAKEYEFVLVVPPLRIRGGTGSALRSFALVP